MSSNEIQQGSFSPKVKKESGLSPLWLLPIVTIILAGWLVVGAINDAGERIQIHFSDAQGLIAGRTTIRYQGLEVGMVKDIKLADDLESIFVDADVYPEATKLLSDETRFWLVKPTASLSGISGLDALVSGNYIAIHPGGDISDNDDNDKTVFLGLDHAPSDLLASEGTNIILRSTELGSISIGSQIVYKKIPIGEVYGYQLDEDAKSVEIRAFIEDEYKSLISTKSRFWNVSGIGAHIGFGGVDVQIESLSAMLGGAIAVDSPDEGEPLQEGDEYKLYPDLNTAGRGIRIQVMLPNDNKINTNGAPVMFKGIEIGQVTDVQLSEDKQHIIAFASVQPSFVDTLNTGTRFLLEEAKLSLTGVENLGNLVTGNFLTLVPGEGEKARTFTAIRKDALLREQNGSLPIQLIADSSYGLEAGSNIHYRGLPVGSISGINLVDEQVVIDALIDKAYARLIKSKNRFYISGNITADLTDSGISVHVPPAKQILSGAISFTSDGVTNPSDSYQLFPSQALAELANFNQSGSQTLTIFSQSLPSVAEGSPLLYRNLQVGKVSSYALSKNGVLIKLKINNQYKHLLSDNTVFWNYSGIKVKADLNGVDITAAPLLNMIKGGIAFDSLKGIENKERNHWKLYNSYDEAKKYGKLITLTSDQNASITTGMKLKYQGVPVGEVTAVTPNFHQENVSIAARILPQYVSHIAKNDSHFWIVQPQVGIRGVKNIESLLGQYINVEPAGTKAKYTFALENKSKATKGKVFFLQSPSRSSLAEGTPILFRDIEVGQVTNVTLGDLSDRIITTIEVAPEYAYLVRENTLFWNVSGVDVSIGLTGAKIKAGTVDSIVRGGIEFATPDTNPLKPIADANQAFLLHEARQPEWKEWRTIIPKPR